MDITFIFFLIVPVVFFLIMLVVFIVDRHRSKRKQNPDGYEDTNDKG